MLHCIDHVAHADLAINYMYYNYYYYNAHAMQHVQLSYMQITCMQGVSATCMLWKCSHNMHVRECNMHVSCRESANPHFQP